MQPQYQPQAGQLLPAQFSSRAPPLTDNVFEVSPILPEQSPNLSSKTSEPVDVVRQPRFSGLHGSLPSAGQGLSPPTNRSLQIASAPSESNNPVYLHTAISAVSYRERSPDLKSPHSNTSSNQTPTQPDFDKPGRNGPVSSLSIPGEQPRLLPEPSSGSFWQSPQDFISESQGGDSQQVPEETLPVTQSSYPSREPRSTEASHNPADDEHDLEHPTQQRLSQSSNGTFHTAGSREQSQRDQRIMNQPASYHLPQSGTQKSVHKNAPVGQDNFLAPSPPTQSREGAKTPDRPISRPFSFMEVSPDRRSKPKEGVLHHTPSMASNSSRNHSDRPPSPVSPQRSMTRDVSSPHDQAISSNQDTRQDSVGHRPRSFSRPFQDPNLHEHPAFRHETPSSQATDFSTDQYPTQIAHEVRLPQQFTTGYQARGVEPPVIPPSENKSKSHRGSRNSMFFKNLTSATRAERPPSVTDPEGRFTESSIISPIPGEIRNKRGSVFRSINSRRGSTREKSRTSIDVPTQAQPPNITQQFGSVKQQNREADIATKSESSKARNKLQRASTSAAVEQDPGKKKRFSALGVFKIRALVWIQLISFRAFLVDQNMTRLALPSQSLNHQLLNKFKPHLNHNPLTKTNKPRMLAMTLINMPHYKNIMPDLQMGATTPLIA